MTDSFHRTLDHALTKRPCACRTCLPCLAGTHSLCRRVDCIAVAELHSCNCQVCEQRP